MKSSGIKNSCMNLPLLKSLPFIFAFVFNYCDAKSQLFINEIFATNASTNLDTKYYNYSDWVELYNSGTTTISLEDYYFSDDQEDKRKWKLPSIEIGANQFVIFWFNEKNNEIYTSFKLSAKGSKLYLTKSDGTIIDQISYPKQYPNISYARYPDGTSNWQYNAEPTIKSGNSDKSYVVFTSNPVFSKVGGLYNNPLSISITTKKTNAEIRYTLDGSEPNQNSLIYTSGISINNTTIIRARVYEPGFLPSAIYTQSYIFPDHQINLPFYSITTNPANLWDNMMGIYVEGTNGLLAYCNNKPMNYNQEWERPVNIEYYDLLGNQQINQYLGIEIGGNCSRDMPQKSFNLIPRSLYGKGKLSYSFFDDKNINSFERIMLRNAGNDWGTCFMRDALCNTLVKSKIDIDYNAYKPSVVFLNGDYWGILDTREKIDKRYIMSNYKLDEDEFDMLEKDQLVINGDSSRYSELINFISSSDMNSKAIYEKIKSQIDINEYINYMITQIFIGNIDWPHNNIKYWCPKKKDGKWRWILTDLDYGFGFYDKNINHNTLQYALEPNGLSWPTLLFRRMMMNNQFKNEFINRFAYYLNTIFEPETVIHTIDSLQNNIGYEIFYHNQKWQGIDEWNANVEFLRTYARLRPDYVRQHLISTFGLSGSYELKVKSNFTNAGKILVDSIQVDGNDFKGTYFKNIPVNVIPIANDGYKFMGWFKQTHEADYFYLIEKETEWKYCDEGYKPHNEWFHTSYNDELWKTGIAQLGYGDGDESTIINFGSDPNNKYTTSYYRKTFNISNVNNYKALKVKILADDGAVVYINGIEVLRLKMPYKTIDFSTLATTNVGGSDENTFFEFDIPLEVLQEGSNLIAVELHQNSLTSSDASFDLQLMAATGQIVNEELIPGYSIDISGTENTEIMAKYEYLGNLPNLYFNEVMAENSLGIKDESGEYTPWIEIYNSTNSEINIAGMYISNDINNLKLWQIPSDNYAKTSINPLGFKTLWTDGQVSEGVLHLPFKLCNSGGQLFLSKITETDTIIIDSLKYSEQFVDVAFGRFKDGNYNSFILSTPTPESTNAAPNQLPIFTSTPVQTVDAQQPYSYNITASDFENDNLLFNYKNLPSWLSLTDNGDNSAILTGTPLNENSGNNTVTITVSDGKSLQPTEQIFTINVQEQLGFEEHLKSNWKIFPNPMKDNVTIIPENIVKSYHVRITNLMGKVMMEKKDIDGEYRLNLSDYPDGVYFLITTVDLDSFMTKLVKVK